MSNRMLLVDTIYFDITPQQISESMKANSGRLIVSGVLQRADTKNQNGRIYPKTILMREASKYSDTFIKETRALGELDHPDSSVVNLKNTSHNILEMHWSGNDLIGTIEVLHKTPSGGILKSLFESGIRLGISSRGLGSTKRNTTNEADEVQDDFELVAFDFVSNPSTHGAFMEQMHESKDHNLNQNKYSKINEIITNILMTL